MAATWTPESDTNTSWTDETANSAAKEQFELLIGGGFKLLIDSGSYYLKIQPQLSGAAWTADAES